ncbi:MAG: hypothetical protein RL577_285 [Bacteroidota bacterium]
MKPQEFFVVQLREMCPAHLNLAEELAALLNLSLDSIYRRLRCETDISLEETLAICAHFELPLTSVLEQQPNTVSFRTNSLEGDSESFTQYLKVIVGDVMGMRSEPEFEIIYAAEDLPVYYNFFFFELARFKMVYWNKSILGSKNLVGRFVEDVDVPNHWVEQVPIARAAFLGVKTQEIWNEDTLKSTLKQIRYYWEAGYFRNSELPLRLCQDLSELVETLSNQAQAGRKYNPLTKEFTDVSFRLYSSDLMIGSNTVALRSKYSMASYLGYHTFNFMRTKNANFNRFTQEWLDNMRQKGVLISEAGEKQRLQFFHSLNRQVEELRDFISRSS